MANAKENKFAPESLTSDVSAAVRTMGATLDLFNRQFLAGITGRFDDTARAMNTTGNKLTAGLQKTFHAFLDTGFKGELQSAESSWTRFCDSLESSFFKAVSRLAGVLMQQVFKGLFDWVAGSIGFSSGGGIGEFGMGGLTSLGSASPSHAATIHPVVEGLTNRGTGILSLDGGMKESASLLAAASASGEMPTRSAAPAALSVHVSIDNQTGMPVKAEQGPVTTDLEKAVVGVVLKSYNEGGSIWQMIRGEKGK